jgi:hypothetical protein
MRLGYLVSQYPAVSHTFVLREVLSLRSRGIDVCVVSVRHSDRPLNSLSADEAAEARKFDPTRAYRWRSYQRVLSRARRRSAAPSAVVP